MQKILTGAEVPADFTYFRSSSPVYRKYLEHGIIRTIDIGKQYGWLKDLKLFQIVKFERTDLPPTRELLEKHGFKRGMVLWIPAHRDSVPEGWRELMLPGSHFMRTGISYLCPEYFHSWNERARRARKKFLSTENLRVEQVDNIVFSKAFSNTKVHHSFKEEYIKYYNSMYCIEPNSVRGYLALNEKNEVLAGLAVHDSGNMSTHLVAFTSRTAKTTQAGTGLIDRWYADSVAIGLKYIDYDHLRDKYMTSDQQGYTNFKLNFIDSLVEYPKCYFQFWKI